jgi:hypothetical protein
MKKLSIYLTLFFLYLSVVPPSFAHAFGATYTLPIPFWLYLFSAVAALLISFLMIGFFTTSPQEADSFPSVSLKNNRLVDALTSRKAQIFYKSLSLFLFFLVVLTGLIGEDISAFNFNMTFFWVVFLLGFTYLTFFLGNIWQVVNPWKILTEIIEQLTHALFSGKVTYPERLSYYPAFFLYLIFICIELFIGTSPFTLSVLLIQYTVITLFATFLFGEQTWFRYGELFSVFFRFISYASPVTMKKNGVRFRLPFIGLLTEKAVDFSMLLFILFMLSSTAFDGFRETDVWYGLYWNFLRNNIGNQLFDIFGLILSPFVFLIIYLFAILLLKLIIATKRSVKELSFDFAFSLLPIALVYNVAHYFTLLLLQGQEIIRLASDPFGWGWNLFGTADYTQNVGIISASSVWHTQVALILGGHIIAVFLAHFMAMKLFAKHREAVLSQIPMLLLMIAYTVIGLWILSQPLAIGS